jgi:TRAP transporter TAXI family solute receptor
MRKLLTSCALASSLLVTAACGAGSSGGGDDLPSVIGIATLPTGSVNHIMGEALAAAITEHSEVTARAEPIGGPEAWVPMLARGEIEFGLASDFDLFAARTGQEPYFDSSFPSLRLVKQARNALKAGILTQADSDIESVDDLDGRKVAYDAPAHAVVLEGTKALMAVYGGPPVDELVSVRADSSTDAVKALMDGRADAALASVGNATNEELEASQGARFLSHQISDENLEAAREILPSLERVTLEPGPTGVTEESDFIAWSINLVSDESIHPKLVELVTEVLNEHYATYEDSHPIMASLAPSESLGSSLPAPVHEGAISYYENTGIWTPEVEDAHEQFD